MFLIVSSLRGDTSGVYWAWLNNKLSKTLIEAGNALQSAGVDEQYSGIFRKKSLLH